MVGECALDTPGRGYGSDKAGIRVGHCTWRVGLNNLHSLLRHGLDTAPTLLDTAPTLTAAMKLRIFLLAGSLARENSLLSHRKSAAVKELCTLYSLQLKTAQKKTALSTLHSSKSINPSSPDTHQTLSHMEPILMKKEPFEADPNFLYSIQCNSSESPDSFDIPSKRP